MPSRVAVGALVYSLGRIDAAAASVESAIRMPIAAGSLRASVAGTELAAEAFAYAAVHLASGSDALLTLRLMAMPDPSSLT